MPGIDPELLEQFRYAYAWWRQVGPRGEALEPFVSGLVRNGLVRREHEPDPLASSPYAVAIRMLDEAWRRKIPSSEPIDEQRLDELLQVAQRRVIGELSRVQTLRQVICFYDPDDGLGSTRVIPKNASGTIVLVHGDRRTFDVEFNDPRGLATVSIDDLQT